MNGLNVARSWRRLMVALLGLAVGSVCFWLAARNVDFNEARRSFGSSDWRWIVSGIVLFGIDLLLRTLRWRVIISHHSDVEYVRLARGLVVGYAVNIILPARLGEFFRADYTARLINIGRPGILASIFIERLLDLFAVLVLFGIGLALAGIQNPTIDRVAVIAALTLTIGTVLIYVAILRAIRQNVKHMLATVVSKLLPDSLGKRVMRIVGDFVNLLDIVRTRRFVQATVLTIPVWIVEAASVFSICRAVGLSLTPAALMLLIGAASLSTLFPTAPGFAGSYQFAFVVVLRNFAVPDTLALVAATGVQVYLMGFYAILGLLVWSFTPSLWSSSSPGSLGKRGVARS